MTRLIATLVTVASMLSMAGAAGCLRSRPPAMTPPEQVKPYSLTVVGKQRLTETPGIAEYVTGWSPDGKKITVTAFQGIMGQDRIYVGMLDFNRNQPETPRSIFPDSRFSDYGGFWSPDGKRISFVSDRAGNYDIWTATRQGRDLRQLTTDPADDVYGAWSPDGKEIAFLSTRSGEVAIWLMNADGSNQRQVTAGGNGDWGTSWSPDGRRILFGSSRISAENKPVHPGDPPLKNFFRTVFIGGVPSEQIWMLDLSTLLLTRMTADQTRQMGEMGESVRHWHPNWSPDGTKIAYVSNQAGSGNIWVMDYDGSHQTRLTTGSTYDVFPAWSPDGTQLAFSSADHEETTADVWVLTLEKVDRSSL